MKLTGMLAAAAFMLAPAQSDRSAEDRVYTAEQATRGKAVIERHCTSCHGEDLSGMEGPALVGSSFLLNWEPRNLDMLFTKIRDSMPPEAVTDVTDEEKLDAIAYLLQQNGFPAGTSELSRESGALARITMASPKSGAQPRTGAFVRTLGCLSQGSDNGWVLNRATAPTPAAASASQKSAPGAPLGTQDIKLMNVFPNPAPHKGHKIEVTGLFMNDSSGTAVNVLSLEMIAADCQ
jgi:mono/diheme cytochrome c family protein